MVLLSGFWLVLIGLDVEVDGRGDVRDDDGDGRRCARTGLNTTTSPGDVSSDSPGGIVAAS